MNMIEAEGINISFRGENQRKIFGMERQQALFDISLHVEEGECSGILDESGSGKNMPGWVLCGLLKPDRGSVYLDGSRLYGGKKNRDRTMVSVVFQDYTTSANLRFRVRNLIAESLTVREKKEKIKMDMERELEHLLDLTRLDTEYRDRFSHKLSGDQLQRVCIVRATAANPGIILFDEAISSLDAHTQAQVMDLLKEIQRKRNLTYVLITHDLTSITYICHNVLFLYQGRVVEAREVDCISQVEHPYAKKLPNSIIEPDDRGITSREEEECRIWEKAT